MADFSNYVNQETLDKLREIAAKSEAAKATASLSGKSDFSSAELDALNQNPEARANLTNRLNPSSQQFNPNNVEFSAIPEDTTGGTFKPSEGTLTNSKPSPEEISKIRLRNAMNRQPGVLVGEPYTPKSNFDQMVERIQPSMRMVSETPDVGSKLEGIEQSVLSDRAKQFASSASAAEDIDAAIEGADLAGKVNVSKAPLGKLDSAMSKFSGLSDEALSKMGAIGQKVLSNRLVSKGLPIVGIGLEGKSGYENLKKGRPVDAMGNALGIASGVATLAGSTAALPLGAASFGVAGGMETGRQQADQAEMGVGDMGMPIPTKQELNKQSNPTDLLAVNAAKYADKFGGSSKSESVDNVLQGIKNDVPVSIEEPSNTAGYNDIPSKTGTSSSVSSATKSSSLEEQVRELFASPQGDGFTNNTVANLQKAQEEAKQERIGADAMAHAAMIGAGSLGQKAHAGPADISEQLALAARQGKDADKIVTDFKDRGEQEKNDAGSAASVQARRLASAMLKQAGINVAIPDNVSAADLEKRFPQLQHMATSKENLEARKDTAREHAADRAALLQVKGEEKADKRFSDMNNKLVEETASSRSAFGKAANINRSGDAIETLINQIPDKNDIDNRQMYEIARSLDAMLSSGAATISGAGHLIPSSASGDLSKIQEYVSGIPKGAKQAEFVKRMAETVRREKELAKKQINTTKDKILAGYSDLKNKDSNRFESILKTHGIDEESKSSSGYPKTLTNGTHSATVSNAKEEQEAKQEGFK